MRKGPDLLPWLRGLGGARQVVGSQAMKHLQPLAARGTTVHIVLLCQVKEGQGKSRQMRTGRTGHSHGGDPLYSVAL